MFNGIICEIVKSLLLYRNINDSNVDDVQSHPEVDDVHNTAQSDHEDGGNDAVLRVTVVPRFTLNEREFVHEDDLDDLSCDDDEQFQENVSRNSRRRVSFKYV